MYQLNLLSLIPLIKMLIIIIIKINIITNIIRKN